MSPTEILANECQPPENISLLANEDFQPAAPPNAAIYYNPDGFDTSRGKLMGRHAAGEEFLKAWARYSDVDKLFCYAQRAEDVQHFIARTRGLGKVDRKEVWIPWQRFSGVSDPGCLFIPGPGIGPFAYQRPYIDERAFSLCGITHTTATTSVMDAIGDLLVAPTQPWDALICTSSSVKSMITNVLDAYGDHIKTRFGMPSVPRAPLQLPVIPLGVDCDAFAANETAREKIRNEWRLSLGIGDDEVVFLYMGRLSFHAKAHPMPTYRGLERAAISTGKPVCLIMAGWFANDSIKNQFVTAARAYCPSVKVIFLDGRKKEVRKNVWFAADAFTSLSDNIQETFGLTPIEAMAAGLPVVASDWDGYRETVRHDVDGFLIPTWMTSSGGGRDLAILNASGSISYDEYIGCQSQFTAVDVEVAANAYTELVKNKQLRRRMGFAARERAKNTYDWSVIIRTYKDLFAELEQVRKQSKASAPHQSRRSENPLRQDPTVLFSSYPSDVLRPDTIVCTTDQCRTENIEILKQLPMNKFAIEKLCIDASVNEVVSSLAEKPLCTVAQLHAVGADARTSLSIDRAVLWLAKMGLISLKNSPRNSEQF